MLILSASLNLPGTTQFHYVAETEWDFIFCFGWGGAVDMVGQTMKLSPQLAV